MKTHPGQFWTHSVEGSEHDSEIIKKGQIKLSQLLCDAIKRSGIFNNNSQKFNGDVEQ